MQDIINILKGITVQELIILLIFMAPSTALMFYFVLKFLGQEIIWKKIVISGVLFGILNLLFRKVYMYYKIDMGSSTLIIAFIFLITIIIFHKVTFIKAAIGTLVCYILIFLGSPVSFKVVSVFNLTVEQIISSYMLNTVIGYTEEIFLIIGTLILIFTKFNINKIMKY